MTIRENSIGIESESAQMLIPMHRSEIDSRERSELVQAEPENAALTRTK
jgi:hypothetical protein